MTPVLMIMILLFYTFNTLKYLVIFLCVMKVLIFFAEKQTKK